MEAVGRQTRVSVTLLVTSALLATGCAVQTQDELAPSAQAEQDLAGLRGQFVLEPAPLPSGEKRPVQLLGPAEVATFRRQGEVLIPENAGRLDKALKLALPARADGAFQLGDARSGAEVSVKLVGAASAEATLTADGVVLYPDAMGEGTQLVHRVARGGTEDFIAFAARPAEEAVRYDVAIAPEVKALRLVENVLEFLDHRGAPRIRMAAPWLIDAVGKRVDAVTTVHGCAVDTSPLPPMGRALASPGAHSCQVQVSWAGNAVAYPALLDPTWTLTGSMSTPRYGHAAALLPDGRVLVAGGYTGSGYTASAEIYDPATGTWTTAASMKTTRFYATGVALDDGRVLVAGGYSYSGTYGSLASADIYDPSTGTWSLAANNLSSSRYIANSAKLPDGRILIFGGYQNHGSTWGALRTADIFDPATASFTAAGLMNKARYFAGAALLPDGRVLAAGGYHVTYNGSTYYNEGPLSSAEIYDPATNTWSFTGSMATARYGLTLNTLSNGTALAAGGYNHYYGGIQPTESFDPATGTWSSAGTLNQKIAWHTGTTLPNGDVLTAGGYGCNPAELPDGTTSGTYCEAQDDAFLYRYSPTSGGWQEVASLNDARYHHTATLLANGKVLVAGGYKYLRSSYSWGILSSAEVFDFCSGTQCTVPPVLQLPGDLFAEATEPGGAVVTFAVSATDNLDPVVSVECTPAAGSLFPLGATAVTCTATDTNGNTASGTFNVNVVDTTPPAVSAHGDIAIEAEGPQGTAITWPSLEAQDIVSGALSADCNPLSGSVFAIGVTQVVCAATDAAGNTGSATFYVHVVDSTAPALMMPPSQVLEATGPAGAVATWSVSATDIADPSPQVSCAPASGDTFPLGTTAVSCTATDVWGNSESGGFSITVQDTTPPVLTVPGPLSAEATGPSGAQVSYVAEAQDVVSGTLAAQCTPPSDSVFALGSTTVQCSATDGAGNTATAAFPVTVADTTPPVLTLPSPITAEATGSTGAQATYAASAQDIVDGAVRVQCSHASGSTFALGSTTVTCSSTDAAGNTSSGSFTVTIVDTTPPALALPAPITSEATGPAGAQTTYAASAQDIVDGAVSVQCSPASGSTFPLGTTTVACSATDAAGNTSGGSFAVTIVDTTPPALSLPAPLTVEATGPAGAAASFTATAQDLVSGAVAAQCTPASGSTFALGTTQVNCSAADAAGNSASGTFTVTVVDTTPPALSLPTSLSAEAVGPSGAPVSWTASAIDLVSGTVAVTCSSTSGTTFPLGATTVNCSAVDAAGNPAQGSFIVTVVDTTPPDVTVPSDIVVVATSAAGNVVTYASSAQDLVDGAITPLCSPASGSVFAPGVTVVTCTATDARGNTGSATFTVSVTFSWTGILAPIDADGSSAFKLGRTVPVKFQLTGGSAGITNLTASLLLVKVSDGVNGSEVEATSTSGADTGNLFRYDAATDQYIYNLSTKGLSVGTWFLRVDMGDGVQRMVSFSIKS